MENQKKIVKIAVIGLSCSAALMAQEGSPNGLNIVLITADDLNCSSTSLFGCPVENITPNIEKLASEGMLFRNAHVASAISQPSRGAIMTGRYPHNSGIDGFYHTTLDIPTFQETLQANNYRIGIMGKLPHSTPKASIKWDLALDGADAGNGRNPQLYYKVIKEFISKNKKEKHPFFFMANSLDPHRPFSGSDQEKEKYPGHPYPWPSRIYKEGEITVPGFLPDILDVRKEICEYFNSVKRMDDLVGAVLQAIRESGVENETMVIFLSDNGMSLPFSKTNCYLHSTHTPLIIKLPGVTKAKSVDIENFVNGIDFMPTVLDAANIVIPEGLDGRSFLPLLKGKTQKGRGCVFTEITETSGRKRFPMRAAQNKTYGYIFNPWADGERIFKNESQSGRTFPAMVAASATNPSIQERVEFFSKRTIEELYDFSKDPDALHNLANDPSYKKELVQMQNLMEKHLKESDDPLLSVFENRYDKSSLGKFMDQQNQIIKDRNIDDERFIRNNKNLKKNKNQSNEDE